MPIFGTGIIPQQGAIANELAATVRRAFIPSVVLQVYKSAPLISALLANALVASGGLSPITQPVQGNNMTVGEWIGYDGSFQQPGLIPGIQNAEFNLAAFVTAIPFLGFEGLVQLDYSTVPLIEARMNDSTLMTIQSWSQALYLNIANQQQLIGMQAAIDDGSFAATYGGIPRATAPWWKSTYVHNASPTALTRNLALLYTAQITKVTGESPKIGILGFGTWNLLAQDFTSQESYQVRPGDSFTNGTVQALFRAIEVAGVPYYPDPYCPEGTLYLINTDYLSMYMHERANFYFTGFESTLPNAQFGFIGAMLSLLQLANVKPQAHGKFDNLSFTNI